MSALSSQERRTLAANIVFQRTELGRFSRMAWLKKFCSYETLVRCDGLLCGGGIIDDYLESMEREWKSIKEWVPETTASILDIGCGVAGIHQWTHRRHEQGCGRDYSLTLCDRNTVFERVYYDFNADGAACNDLSLSKAFLESRGVPAESIAVYDADQDTLPLTPRFDLIMSLLSWGFHYPIETYLDYSKQQLSEDGVMIVDCRRGSGGMSLLEENFDTKIIVEGVKHDRVLCKQR